MPDHFQSLFAVLVASLFCVSAVKAAPGDYVVDFDDLDELPEGWKKTADAQLMFFYYGSGYCISNDYSCDGGKGLYTIETAYAAGYIITEMVQGDVSFNYRAPNKSYGGGVKLYEYSDAYLKELPEGSVEWEKSNASTTVKTQTFTLSRPTRLAIRLCRAVFDDFVAEKYEDNGAIPKPSLFAVSAVSYSSATFVWNRGGNERSWQMAVDTDPHFDKDRESPAPIEVLSNPFVLSGLKPETSYYAYLRAVDGDDVSSWTSMVSFTTPARFPVPKALTVSDETTSTARLSWTEASVESAWEIAYADVPGFDPDREGVRVESTTTWKMLTGLTPHTTYYACVRARYGDADYSAWTEKVSFKTLQVATAADGYVDDFESVNNWKLVNGSMTNAWAWGTAACHGGTKALYISDDGGRSHAYGHGYTMVYATQLFSFPAGEYVVDYDWLCKGEKSSWGTTAYDYLRVVLAPAESVLTAGTEAPDVFSSTLLPDGWIAIDGGTALVDAVTWQHKTVTVTVPVNANYYVVFAWCNDNSEGSNPPAAVDNFSMRFDDTPTPADLQVSALTAHTATLTWADTDNTFEVCLSSSAAAPAVDVAGVVASAANSYVFTDLESETAYYAWVRSVSRKNPANKSEWAGISFTTAIACAAPMALTVSNISATSATLAWTPGADETLWDLVYGHEDDPLSESNTAIEVTATPAVELTRLTPETVYYVFVRARVGDEVSRWAGVSFTPSSAVQLTLNDSEQTNEFVPVYGYYADGVRDHSQFIIPAASLADVSGGEITKLTFYARDAVAWGEPVFKVYVKEVDEAEFATAAFVDWDTMTEVYSGTLTMTDNQMEVAFVSPFLYSGKNLLVGLSETAKGGYAHTHWYGTMTDGFTAVTQNDYSTALALRRFLPKTTVTFVPLTGARMQLSTTTIDFGTVTSLPQTGTFTISNRLGKNALIDLSVSCTGQGFSVSDLPRTFITTQGDDSADITVTVIFSPAAGGDYAGTVMVAAAGQTPQTIALRGTYLTVPRMAVYNEADADTEATTGQTQDFGYVQTIPVYTYYVKNTGVGTLHVQVDDCGLTVVPSAASLAAGQQQAFTITPIAQTDATVTFLGTDHADGSTIGLFDLTLRGEVMPLTGKFFENFDGADGAATADKLPGWDIVSADNSVELHQGYIRYWALGTETASIITPKLYVAGFADAFRVSAYARNLTYYNTRLAVYYSADKHSWTELDGALTRNSFGADGATGQTTFAFMGIPEGLWYIRLDLSDVAVDYLYGFTPETSAIGSTGQHTPADRRVYNLQGQRIQPSENARKGLYIVDGKKILR